MQRWLLIAVVACTGAPKSKPAERPVFAPKQKPVEPPRVTDLEKPAPHRFLADIDWSTVKLASTGDALALWARIAPTGLDWEDKLEELPAHVERPLALALLEGGNFRCMPAPPSKDCVAKQFDVDEPAQSAGFTDPCLRRLLALWALDKIEDADLPRLRPVLEAIVAIPPPESELVAAVLAAVPEGDHALRLALLAVAARAGQHDVIVGTGGVGKLDEQHLIEAVIKHHIDGALEILSAEGHRAAYLAAITDELLATKTRTTAMFDLVATAPKLAADTRAALAKASASKDCTVAATAARLLEQAGDKRFVPTRARAGRTTEQLMRGLCVLASYEQQQRADETSLVVGYVPRKGLEKVVITYDPLGEVDHDGDGDPHTERTLDLVPRAELVLPEVDDLVKAFRRCTGTTCKSEDREVRFVLKPIGGQLLLARIELVDRPPCPKP